jgi:DhnA family fructose-bisphosphate aldolase class Ia
LRRRLNRLQVAEGRYSIFALDHPLSVGLAPGLEDTAHWVHLAETAPLSGTVLHIGELTRLPFSPVKGVVLQLMGAPATTPSEKTAVATVTDAIRLDADAVAVQLSFEEGQSSHQLTTACRLMADARRYGLPVLLMVNSYGRVGNSTLSLSDAIKMAAQLGPDLIKVPVRAEDFRDESGRDLATLLKASPPVLAAGGPLDKTFLETLRLASDAGFSGTCLGRNIFQSTDPEAVSRQVTDLFAVPTSRSAPMTPSLSS